VVAVLTRHLCYNPQVTPALGDFPRIERPITLEEKPFPTVKFLE